MSSRGLLVFGRDPGATNILVATLEALSVGPKAQDAGGLRDLRIATSPFINNLKIATRASAVERWRSAGYEPIVWHGDEDAAASRLLEESRAGVLLTGTSDIDERGDRALWRAAKSSAIGSHAVLDHPAHLQERFTDADGRVTWPEFLYVPDVAYIRHATDANVPPQRIRILGDLHHNKLRELAAARTPADVASLRGAWEADKSTFVILFASECVREMKSKGAAFSFDEIVEFDSLLRSVTEGKRPGGGALEPGQTLIVIRPHPRDLAGKYEEVTRNYKGPVRILTSDRGSPDLALLAADVVAGMESSLLYEAVILGRPAVSLTGHDIFAGKSIAGNAGGNDRS